MPWVGAQSELHRCAGVLVGQRPHGVMHQRRGACSPDGE